MALKCVLREIINVNHILNSDEKLYARISKIFREEAAKYRYRSERGRQINDNRKMIMS